MTSGQYPDELFFRQKYFAGTVIVEFQLTAKGEVEAPWIVQASHPAFVPPSIERIYASKFAPGTIGGAPVASLFRVSLYFQVLDRGREIGSQTYVVPEKSAPGCPPELRYDGPPVVVTVCDPVYPLDLLLAGTRGKARVRYIVDQTGRVAAGQVVSATNHQFGVALLAAIEAWHFTPPLLHGTPTMTMLFHDYEFNPKTFLFVDAERRLLKLWQTNPATILDAASLERQPRLVYQVAPQYPRALKPERAKGEAEVEFVIDRNGRVRLPRVVSATREEFGWAAVTAVQQWLYEPPRVQGKATDVRMRIPLKFTP